MRAGIFLTAVAGVLIGMVVALPIQNNKENRETQTGTQMSDVEFLKAILAKYAQEKESDDAEAKIEDEEVNEVKELQKDRKIITTLLQELEDEEPRKRLFEGFNAPSHFYDKIHVRRIAPDDDRNPQSKRYLSGLDSGNYLPSKRYLSGLDSAAFLPSKRYLSGLDSAAFMPSKRYIDGLSSGFLPSKRYLDGLSAGLAPSKRYLDSLSQGLAPSKRYLDSLSQGFAPSKRYLDSLSMGLAPNKRYIDGLGSSFLPHKR